MSPVSPKLSANKAWLRALERTREVRRASTLTLAVAVEAMAQVQGDAPALIGEGEAFGYAELATRLRAYARWALEQGLVGGEVVALLAPNRPEYLACWLGVTRVGGVVALINSNLRGLALEHCLKVSGARHLIVDPELADEVPQGLGLRTWTLGACGPADGRSGAPLAPHEDPAPTLAEPALLIYTSGTTGLPKAAHVSHHRVMMWSGWFAGMMDATPDDRLYDCLPLYHSVGGVVATGAMLVAGGSVVIRKRFSASHFWADVTEQGCTVFQYIGELCRYLLAAPPGPNERAHRLRLACGNGLRGEVWRPFQDRFAIPQVLEFYASTEGAFSLYNAEGEPGAIGRVPPFLAHRFPAAIVRFDPIAERPVRGEDGLCIACARGEAGEALGRIAAPDADAANRFEGYTDAGESARKVLRDVFEPGDAWLRTGDLMRQDARGFWYFVDRVGDTFRWKGENVATSEVAAAVEACAGVVEACVYGVAVPGADGRAGMAAVVAGEGFELARLHAHLAERLPAYARPLFVRLTDELATTETFKLKKQALVEAGFDPARTRDPIYLDFGGGYTPLDGPLSAQLNGGRLRL
ncbi:long-chain-acyl-CoA synthetase [Caulobacter sp. S45]|uniref:long-chain-acyl-CoA synthetase n=1 Tax=Caulobacter sp. S45 TaxID=1641861 RepID=UPI00131B88A2|nr:long-chain-acyl-CoA synthetase [Caulobacter sp. S45]